MVLFAKKWSMGFVFVSELAFNSYCIDLIGAIFDRWECVRDG